MNCLRLNFNARSTYSRLLLPLAAALYYGAASAADVLTFHNDNQRTGANTGEVVLNQSNVNFAQFGKLFSRDVDGIIYAQPLYVSSLSIAGATHNVVFVATMHNTIYAFDADDGNQPPYWQKSMGAAVPYLDVFTNGDTNMYPEIGILSTPVIDPTTNTLYLLSMTKEGTNSFAHRMHALDLATGAEKFDGPVQITAPLFDSFRQGQRPGLLLANGSVYFGFASFGDQAPYWGFQMRYDAATLSQQAILNTNPANVSGPGAGIWQSGCGAAADIFGNVYCVTGNGASRDARLGGANYSECALKLSPSLAVLDFFMPSAVDNIDGADADFGGGGHVILPDQPGSKPHLMVCAGKAGVLYLLDRDNMTHFAADADARVVQNIAIGSNKGTPVYWAGPNGPRIFVQNEFGGSIISYALAVDPGKGYAQLTQQSTTPFGFPAHQMALSSNAGFAGTGIIWAYGNSGGDVVHQTDPDGAILYAFNAETLEPLYNSEQTDNGRDVLGGFAKYNTPTIANGKVYVPSSGEPATTSQLLVYGLLADNSAPTISSVTAVNTNTRVLVVFSEPVDAASATTTGNYAIDHGVTVSAAALGTDLRTVTLTTSALSTGITYTLTVNNVTDRAVVPNTIAPGSQKIFTYQVIPPTVSIIAPLPGTTYTAPAVLSISAIATAAPSAGITKVDFFLNGIASGAATSAPFTITIPNVPAGTYALTAKATDNNTVSTTSAAISIKVNPGTGTYGLETRDPIGPYLNAQFPTLSTGTLPATLSATGAFAQLSNLTPASGLIPYTVNSPLWSDAAQKQRWLAIGNSGAPYTPAQQIGFAPTGEWTFPNGTVFVKHFELGTDDTNPSIKKRLETRFIVRSADGNVYGVTYKWRPDQSDADLLTAAGLDEDITIATATGTRTQTWHYPSRNECLTCHTNNAKGVLGVKTRQLNSSFTYPATGITDNQLRTFNHLGLFNPPPSESAIPTYARVVAVTDTSATLEHRARSYIDANCSFCHRPGGTNAFFDARYDTLLSNQKIINGAVINNLGISGAKIVVPKDTAHSLLYQRVNMLGGFKMPPLAHNVIDSAAAGAIADWIGTLPTDQLISLNFQADSPEVFPALAPAEVAGAVPRANWNNALGANGTDMALLDSGGAATSTTVSWNATTTRGGTPDDSPDEKVLADYLGSGGVSVTVSNIPYPLYDVYLYSHAADREAGAPAGRYFVDSIAHPFDDPDYKTMSFKDYGGTGFWTESDGRGSPGHYMIWKNLKSAQLVFSVFDDEDNPGVVSGFQLVPVLPTILSLSPNQGLPSGGETVVIKGTGFVPGAVFTFGGVAATNITFVDVQTYTMRVPAHAVGTVDVAYANGALSACLAGAYNYTNVLLPVISTIVPNLGPPAGGTNVVISGANFRPNATVLFGGENGFNFAAATGVTLVDSARINCVAPPSSPPGTLGNTMIQVINTDGTVGSKSIAYRYAPPAPTISAIVPNQGITLGGNLISITGTGFVSTMRVSFAGVPARNTTVNSSTSLTCIVPPSANETLGPVDVVITDGTAIPYTLTLPGGYIYIARAPEFANANDKIPGVCAKYFFTARPDVVFPAAGPDFLDALLPYNAKVLVTDALANGTVVQESQQPNFFGRYDAKVSGYIKIVSPGVYTLFTTSQDASLFFLGDAPAAALVLSNNFDQVPTRIGGKVYLGSGLHRFTILYSYGGGNSQLKTTYKGPDTGDEQVVIPDDMLFTDPAPSIISASPDSGSVGGNTQVTLTGTGFIQGSNVAVNAVQALNVHISSSTSLTFTTPGGTEGELKIVVLNPNGSADSIPFTYDTTSFRSPDTPSNTVPGSLFRFYHSGFTGVGPSGPLVPDFTNVTPYRVGALPNAMYLPENTIVYPVISESGFSFQYTGYLMIPSDGTYNFYTASDDGSRLFIGNYLVVDNNFAQSITARGGNPIKLKAGLHKYTMQYAEGEPGFGSYIGWGSADAVPPIPVDNDTPHDGPPTTLIPDSAFFYVPPTWKGFGSSPWSNPGNWNTDAGFGAFAPVQLDNTAASEVSLVLRFPAVGSSPYTSINDSVASTPLNVLELSSNIPGNTIAGNQLQFVGTTGVHYQGLTQPNVLQLGSGSVTVSAPIFVREDLNLGGNGAGVVTLSGALTNYSTSVDGANLSKNGSSTYVLAGDGSGFTLGSIALNGGTLCVNSTVNAAAVTVSAGTLLRGTGVLGGTLTVKGVLFPGNLSSTQPTEPKGTFTADSADFTTDAGTLRQRVWLKDPTHAEADLLTITGTSTSALLLDATSILDLRVQVPNGVTIVDNLDVEIVHGGNDALNTYSSGFGNVSVTGTVSNMKVIYVNKDFVPNSGDLVNVVATQLPGQAPVPAIGPESFNRIFIRFNNAVTPVKIDSFSAAAEGAGVLLQWTVLSEYQNAGFNVWRRPSGAASGGWQKVNAGLVPGRITHADVRTYHLYDWPESGMYLYRLESVNLRGASEYFADYAAFVLDRTQDNCLPLSHAGLAAALQRSEQESSTARAAHLSNVMSDAQLATAESQPSVDKIAWESSLTGRLTRLDCHTDKSVLRALGLPSVEEPIACANRAIQANTLPEWLAPRELNLDRGSFAAAKVLYRDSGIIKISQTTLPKGFNARTLNIEHEGRSVPALAATKDAVILYAPGYADQYTDKDAFFLTASNSSTPVETPGTVKGLFGKSIIAAVNATDTVHVDYHDIYFDFSLRPYDYPPWFSSQYLTEGSRQSFTVNAPLAIPTAATLTVDIWSLTGGAKVSPDHSIQAFVNGKPVGALTWDGGGMALALTFQVPSKVLVAGTNTVELVTPQIPGVASQISFVHGISLQYTKSLRSAGSMQFTNTVKNQVYEISALPSQNVWIVDARYPNNFDRARLVPCETQAQSDGTYKARFTATNGGTGKYLVVPYGSELSPLSVTSRTVKAQSGKTQYLAVGPKQFATAIQPLLAAHTKEGMKCLFVDQEDIFDYYGYGRYGPDAIRNAVRAVSPDYLLLVGRTTYDYRNYSGLGVDPLCPTFLVSTTFWAQATSDSLFGDFDRTKWDVAVGRLPVNTVSELTQAVKRILDYKGLAASGPRIHAVADKADADAGDFAAQAESIAKSDPSLSWQRNYLGVTYKTAPEVTSAMKSAASGGADWILYVGHGNAARLGNEVPRILDTDTVQTWTGNVIFMQSTCTANWMAKDEPGYKSIAIQALTQPQGGISASIASSTYTHSQFAVAFMNQLIEYTDKNGIRWGDALLRTQQWAHSQGGGMFEDLSKTEQLFGDPAMPIYKPTRK